jgi:hypothetical protein
VAELEDRGVLGLEDCGDEPPEPPFDCRVSVMLVEPGVAPGALPTTSIVVFPPCSVAIPVNTPFPTAAGWPCIWTTALGGLTVPRMVTVSAAITLPLVGEVTTTVTVPEPEALVVLVVVVVVEPQPARATASATTIPMPESLITPDRLDTHPYPDPTRRLARLSLSPALWRFACMARISATTVPGLTGD